MSSLIYVLIFALFIYTIYGIFGVQINDGITYIVSRINNLSCFVPKQAVRLFIYLFIIVIIKVILHYLHPKW